ncbi:MAG: hydantoinase/oxoprolinase N-terminal domain-containing protein [Thermomicrobiales bacterium]
MGVIATTKVLSTPGNPALAVVSALDKVIDPASPPPMMIHGSTVATNAVLERKGVRTGFLTTSGFTDIPRTATPGPRAHLRAPVPEA